MKLRTAALLALGMAAPIFAGPAPAFEEPVAPEVPKITPVIPATPPAEAAASATATATSTATASAPATAGPLPDTTFFPNDDRTEPVLDADGQAVINNIKVIASLNPNCGNAAGGEDDSLPGSEKQYSFNISGMREGSKCNQLQQDVNTKFQQIYTAFATACKNNTNQQGTPITSYLQYFPDQAACNENNGYQIYELYGIWTCMCPESETE